MSEHQGIRDELLALASAGFPTRCPQAGSYVFPTLPELRVAPLDFVRLLRQQVNVIVTPGAAFGPHAHSICLNFWQERSAAADAARRIAAMVELYKI